MTMTRVLLLAAVTCLAPTASLALPIASSLGPPLTLNSFDFSTAGSETDPWLLDETFTGPGPGTLALTDTDGQPLGDLFPFASGSWFLKTVTNSSGVAWTSFEIELQELLGVASGEGDGLSFAEGLGFVFSSSVFPDVARVDITRDSYLFSGATVPDGGQVTFAFAVTDNSPQSPVYLQETPNRTDGPVIPEPTTLLLVGSGLAAVVRGRFRRGSEQGQRSR
jgi:hypothetical protein